MANKKKKRNSNYVTEKTIAKHKEAELAAKKRARAKRIKAWTYVGIVALVIAATVIGILAAAGVFSKRTPTHHATIEIENYGTIHLELYGNAAPKTVENFVKLANEGFYDGLTFHRIIEDFMAQGGDPNGDGTGGSGTKIEGEFKINGFRNPIKHKRGTISMARGDDYDSASSQFFIVHKTSENNSLSLDGNYAAFGMVTEGMEIIDKMIEEAETIGSNGTVLAGTEPKIKSITVHEVH
jgi:peptidyl-prolyl cis-trans isomerase B (cyclophilin B)